MLLKMPTISSYFRFPPPLYPPSAINILLWHLHFPFVSAFSFGICILLWEYYPDRKCGFSILSIISLQWLIPRFLSNDRTQRISTRSPPPRLRNTKYSHPRDLKCPHPIRRLRLDGSPIHQKRRCMRYD
jgi:hypothetical protein